VEILLCFALVLPKTRRYALLSSIFMFCAFASFTILRMVKFPEISCGCMGSLISLPAPLMLGINLVVAFASAYAYYFFPYAVKSTNPSQTDRME
jgi:hypothetical protein